MRSPVLLLPPELLVLVTLASFAVIETPARDDEGPVVLAAFTEPLVTVTPGLSKMLNAWDGPPVRLRLVLLKAPEQVRLLPLLMHCASAGCGAARAREKDPRAEPARSKNLPVPRPACRIV